MFGHWPVSYTHLDVYKRQVYTQPDRPAGRGRGMTASPVKREATRLGIPVLQPESLRGEPVSYTHLDVYKRQTMT